MAREPRDITELERVHEWLDKSAKDVEKALGVMKRAGMDELLVHGSNVINRRVPEVMQWSLKLLAEAEEQARSHEKGITSKAEADKRRAEAQAAREKARRKSQGNHSR